MYVGRYNKTILPLRRIPRRFAIGALSALALIILFFWARPQLVLADVYGVSNYSGCSYSSCSQTTASPAQPIEPQHTITQLPSGLEVAINLRNGQAIPKGGYDIVVTPLNGAGSSFKQADFYINGTFVHTQTPAADGTATWHWDPGRYPGTNIKVVITDTNGQTTVQNFTVRLVNSQTQPTPVAAQAGGGLLGVVPAPVTRIIQHLPAPIIYGFPYLLLLLLGTEVLILLWQGRRELIVQRKLGLLLAAQQDTLATKRTFLQLISHYLRTPDTLIRSGADGLLQDGIAPQAATAMQAAAADLHTAVETAISTSEAAIDTPMEHTAESSQLSQVWFRRWRQKILVIVPIVLVGVILFVFVYVANHATRFRTNSLTVATQLAVFALLVLAAYLVFRRLHLRHSISRRTQELLGDQALLHTAQDKLLTEAVQNIAARQAVIVPLAAALLPTPNTKFIHAGLDRLQTVINKCLIANKLQGGRITGDYHATSLAALQKLAEAYILPANQSGIARVQTGTDVNLASQDTQLQALVLGSVLDNALAYSPADEPITVSATTSDNAAGLTVYNAGLGITEDRMMHVFEPFYKAEGAEVFTHEGMGFSLYLDKLIMQYLGGSIALDSEPGKGVTVTINWPIA